MELQKIITNSDDGTYEMPDGLGLDISDKEIVFVIQHGNLQLERHMPIEQAEIVIDNLYSLIAEILAKQLPFSEEVA